MELEDYLNTTSKYMEDMLNCLLYSIIEKISSVTLVERNSTNCSFHSELIAHLKEISVIIENQIRLVKKSI